MVLYNDIKTIGGVSVKKILFILVMAVQMTAFAQDYETTTTMRMPSPGMSQRGFYIGMDYINITDLHITINSARRDSGSSHYYYEGGTHLGAAGITLGYNQTPERGVGFSVGGKLLQTFNSSEDGDQKVQFWIPEANLTLAMSRTLAAYLGLNTSFWTGAPSLNDYRPQVGGQAGLSLRFTKNVALNLGYLMMHQSSSISETDYRAETDLVASGFNSNVVYNF
jgi:opacity protein-like surface antigen